MFILLCLLCCVHYIVCIKMFITYCAYYFIVFIILQCQSYVRRMLAQRKALPQAKKDFNKNRKKILREIVNTESAYVKHLETLVDLYLDNLIEKCDANELGGVTKKDLDDIFPESTREIKNIAGKFFNFMFDFFLIFLDLI